jgi:hypothetical protein
MSPEHEKEPRPEEKKLRAILKDLPSTSADVVDAERKKQEAAKRREGLCEELRPLIEEWKRIEGQAAELQANKVANDDPFLKRSIEARKTAIGTRLAQIDEALNALNKDPGAGQP